MTASNREASISKTLSYEGGFTNDPRDPGGATNWGITIFDARLYWKPDATPEDVRCMPKSVAIEIYRQKYWAKLGCDERPSGVDFVEFDFGVNSGVKRSLAYRSQLDPQKLAPVAYVKAFCAKRSSFLHGLKTWSVFGKGWGRRVADVEATGVRMALGASGKSVAKGLKNEATKNAGKAIAHSTAGASTGAVVNPVIQHLDFSTVAGWVVAGIVLGGVIYFIWAAVQHNHRANAYTHLLKNAN
ncbi:lysozyme family protein [Bradyrhizobium japonicum]|uniref:glycoside hydrolase family 108 protein n=1 Tax=Bradyrhizobium japonicum TaxID=375 RepID=UPI00209F6627|nr:glycosyl hydrolase 108 family protein [Bradyrhizobium japonicum]MCP1937384.1 lysozyme family protein [Bradyrhizobium japonicum]